MSSDKENSITVSQGTLKQDMSKARTAEKKKSTTEKIHTNYLSLDLDQEAKFVDNAIKLEEDITMNQARSGSFMEVNVSGQPWGWMAEQSGLNGSEGIKDVCNLSSLEILDGMDPTIRCSGSIVEPNQSMSCSISDSSNGSDYDLQECLEILNIWYGKTLSEVSGS
ncbi:hypothetical protein ISN45_Aa02g013880 [Arabidopsis thaliana x Arabidopsis arenosa]|uniref:Uncharacterized protein n=1 Tax=Arabidopsis thaliana x Arabidopsis arenosa TaxID=1240361 RepID=A0A8T2BFI2_9BRAS|nr:hypothetical protein ISN45_Aa02g013880 [Arabidopsis thaliana x Arabidopsis arenosa]